VTLALHALRRDETLVCVITRLLDQIAKLHISIKRLYLDRGFYCVPVIRWLQACDIPLEMPVIVRGKQGGTRALVQRKRTYKTSYTMHSQSYGSVTFQVWVSGVGGWDIRDGSSWTARFEIYCLCGLQGPP
jgi:putative transposase